MSRFPWLDLKHNGGCDATFFAISYVQTASMEFHDLLRHRKPETGPLPALGRKEGLEYVRENIGRNALAGVADDDLDGIVKLHFLGGDRDRAAFRHRLRSIQQQVHQDLRQLVRIGADLRQVGRYALLQRDSPEHRLVLQEMHGLTHEAIEVHLINKQRPRTSVVQQPTHR